MEARCLPYAGRVGEGEDGEDHVLGERGPSLNQAGEPGVSQSHPLTISPTGTLPYRCGPRTAKPQILAEQSLAYFRPAPAIPASRIGLHRNSFVSKK